jgi:hypothetical protein
MLRNINIHSIRVVHSERESATDWFNLCDKVFKFIGWLILSGAVFAIWHKTSNFLFIVIFSIQSFMIGVMISKLLLVRIHIYYKGDRKFEYYIARISGVIVSVAVFVGIAFAVANLMLQITVSVSAAP